MTMSVGRLLRPLGALVVLALASACADTPRPLFEEASAAAGLDVVLTCGEHGVKATILEVNGNGAALSDLDGDGDLDIVLVDGSTRARWRAGERVRHHVFRNEGVTDGIPRFAPVEDHGLEQEGWPTGIAVGDVDRDGRPDLLIGGLGEDALFLNRSGSDGSLRFEKRPLPGRDAPLDWTTSVALGDYDGDGLLDALLGRYLTIDPADPPLGSVGGIPCRFEGLAVMCGPHGLPPQPDVMLRGLADGPLFERASLPGAVLSQRPGYALGVLLIDLDGDGWLDIYVANDSVANRLLRNDRTGGFDDVSAISGTATDMAGRAQAGMGVDAGDLDRDGDLELVVTNFSAETNALYRNDGGLLFRDVTAATGLAEPSRPRLGWGVHLADFDADGWLDLYVSNGHVFPQADQAPSGRTSYAQVQQLFLGRADGRLAEVEFPDQQPIHGRASVRGDLDGDGDLDLLTLTLDGAPRLYLNRTDTPERQMLVSLMQTVDGADQHAPGATLHLDLPDGPRTAQVQSASGFQGSNDPRLHLAGTGTATKATVRWPAGELQTLDAARFAFGRHVVVRRGEGVVDSQPLRAVGEGR